MLSCCLKHWANRNSNNNNKMSGNDLEVYIYRGNDGEEVPDTVEKLIVEEGVQVLQVQLCFRLARLREVSLPTGLVTVGFDAFCECKKLLEISIPHTVESIGEGAFDHCEHLKKVDFEMMMSTTLPPHQLQTIDEGAFYFCTSLERIQLPSSVTSVGRYAFAGCQALVEANLSKTDITEVRFEAFKRCTTLRTITLSKKLEQIGTNAFAECDELVSVVVPFDSQPIKIGRGSFENCSRLANFVLRKGSTAENDSFTGCELLWGSYGNNASSIIAGLIGRFDDLPIHRMCYYHSTITGKELQQLPQMISVEQEKGCAILDGFQMTALHVLCSNHVPNMELFDVILNSLPYQMLTWRDDGCNRPLDYLIRNWTDGSVNMLRNALQKCVVDPLYRWGTLEWAKDIEIKADGIVDENDKEARVTLLHEIHMAFEIYVKMESTSILELALWKWKFKSGQITNREGSRLLSGADIVLPPVANFLGRD